MNDRRSLVRTFVILMLFGLVSLLGMVGKPNFEAIRLVDAVRLIGTGMCFGAAVVALVLSLRASSPGEAIGKGSRT
jgi:hypothetical protein